MSFRGIEQPRILKIPFHPLHNPIDDSIYQGGGYRLVSCFICPIFWKRNNISGINSPVCSMSRALASSAINLKFHRKKTELYMNYFCHSRGQSHDHDLSRCPCLAAGSAITLRARVSSISIFSTPHFTERMHMRMHMRGNALPYHITLSC